MLLKSISIVSALLITGCGSINEYSPLHADQKGTITAGATRTPTFPETISPSVSTKTPHPENDSTLTLSPVPLETPTQEATKEEPSLDLPTPAAGGSVNKRCLSISENPVTALNLKGILMLDNLWNINWYSTNPDRKVYHLDLSNEKIDQMQISKAEYNSDAVYSFSPDWKHYFYIELLPDQKSTQLHILSMTGKEQPVPHWEKKWGWNVNVEWLDDQKIIVFLKDNTDLDVANAVILNLQDNSWKKIAFQLNNPLSLDTLIISINPKMSQLYYLDGTNYDFFDIGSHKDLWRKAIDNLWLSPTWAPEGEGIAAVAPSDITINNRQPLDEIYYIDSSGKDSQLTRLHDAYPGMKYIGIDNYSWSPDGRYIAFSISAADDKNEYKVQTLEILNLKTGEVIDTCLTTTISLTWSPDGKQLVVTVPENYDVYKQFIHHPEITFQSKVVLIDLQSYAAYDIFSNSTAVTWSK